MDRCEEKSGVMAQTSSEIPPAFVTDVRCRHHLRMIKTLRVANVATVIISAESITDVKTCNRVRTASDEEVQNSSSKRLLNKALRSSSIL